MGTVKVSVDFNRANALSLREYVALLEVKSEHGEKTYRVTFKVVTSGVCLSFEIIILFERYQITHGRGLQNY